MLCPNCDFDMSDYEDWEFVEMLIICPNCGKKFSLSADKINGLTQFFLQGNI